MTEFITIPFYKGRALENEIKVHDSLKDAKKYAKQYLEKNGKDFTIEISEF